VFVCLSETTVSNVISMDERSAKGSSQKTTFRDRRYAIRYPFAADAVLIDLESGAQANGVTSDISLGGCFICTSKPLALKARVRITLSRKGQSIEALGLVRIVKARIGMGVEFIDLDQEHVELLSKWIEQLRQTR
jgi:PilZ domain